LKCIFIESYFIKIIKNTKSKLKEPQKHIKMTRPNHKFDLAQKRKPKKAQNPKQKYQIKKKSTKAKTKKAQKVE